MEYKAPKEAYKGVVREVTIGKGDKALKVGGENILPFHFFDEGSLPNPPKFALEVFDMEPMDKIATPDRTLWRGHLRSDQMGKKVRGVRCRRHLPYTH